MNENLVSIINSVLDGDTEQATALVNAELDQRSETLYDQGRTFVLDSLVDDTQNS